MGRRPPGVTNSSDSVHWPGAYSYVLHHSCRERAHAEARATGRAPGLMELGAEMEVAELELAARFEELVEERRGTTIPALSYQLPPGLPPPFRQFDDGQHEFTVTPDDVVRGE